MPTLSLDGPTGRRSGRTEVAEIDRIAPPWWTCILRFALLAPDIVEAILNSRWGPRWRGHLRQRRGRP